MWLPYILLEEMTSRARVVWMVLVVSETHFLDTERGKECQQSLRCRADGMIPISLTLRAWQGVSAAA